MLLPMPGIPWTAVIAPIWLSIRAWRNWCISPRRPTKWTLGSGTVLGDAIRATARFSRSAIWAGRASSLPPHVLTLQGLGTLAARTAATRCTAAASGP